MITKFVLYSDILNELIIVDRFFILEDHVGLNSYVSIKDTFEREIMDYNFTLIGEL